MDTLGPVETARFLTLPRYRYADTVEWHRHRARLRTARVWRLSADADALGRLTRSPRCQRQRYGRVAHWALRTQMEDGA
jgi:hypothetical protein